MRVSENCGPPLPSSVDDLAAPWDPSISIPCNVHSGRAPPSTAATWGSVGSEHACPAYRTSSRQWDPRSSGTCGSPRPAPGSRALHCARSTCTSGWASELWPYFCEQTCETEVLQFFFSTCHAAYNALSICFKYLDAWAH